MAVTLTYAGSEGTPYTFTFNPGDVDKITSTITTELDVIAIPLTGPMQNFIYDFEGVKKMITVTGKLTLATSSRISPTYTVTSILNQKQWLESICNGAQNNAITFVSNYEKYSVSSDVSNNPPYFSDAPTGSSALNVPTTVKITKLDFTEEEANPDQLPFILVLEVGT